MHVYNFVADMHCVRAIIYHIICISYECNLVRVCWPCGIYQLVGLSFLSVAITSSQTFSSGCVILLFTILHRLKDTVMWLQYFRLAWGHLHGLRYALLYVCVIGPNWLARVPISKPIAANPVCICSLAGMPNISIVWPIPRTIICLVLRVFINRIHSSLYMKLSIIV